MPEPAWTDHTHHLPSSDEAMLNNMTRPEIDGNQALVCLKRVGMNVALATFRSVGSASHNS